MMHTTLSAGNQGVECLEMLLESCDLELEHKRLQPHVMCATVLNSSCCSVLINSAYSSRKTLSLCSANTVYA